MLKLLLYTTLTNTSKIWAWFSFYINESLHGTHYRIVFVNASSLIDSIKVLVSYHHPIRKSIESIEEWIGDTGTLQYGTYYYLFDDFFSLARENARLQMFFALGDVSQKKKR